ncbi:hypothetical protein [Mangrovibrevibacter kandeliae]|uniref:hypothetical protein n=1 Tax=Mangrovibrevibacter kandeliae TaxID=2968473 RepID=UPI002117F0B2|nr:hypothetical protein [Aurantimonas sp. CSK15Z-1]MCQ8781477.1 hypothetical protein [Aurantimonas sp. CSK15Z-1]
MISIEVEIDDETAGALDELAREKGHADRPSLLLQMIAAFVQRETEPKGYDAWFRDEVESALREMDEPGAEFVAHEDVMSEARERLESRLSQAGKRAG